MTSRLTIAAAVLAGAAIGATAVGGLKAQGKPPVYVVAVFSEMNDLAAFAAASKGVPGAIQAAGGKLLARSDSVAALDGATPPKRIAIFQFESSDKAKEWIKSDGMKETEAARAKHTKSGVFLIDGM